MAGTKIPRTIGVLGLGIIGSRVANLISQAGEEVWVWNRTPKPIPRSVGKLADLAELVETILVFVKDGPALLECLDQLAPNLAPRHLVINHATISPVEASTAHKFLQARNVGFLNAPFTGSRDAAAAAELVYYVGGEPTLLDRARPILEISAKAILATGTIEAAATVKIATNLMAASIVSSLAEAWKLSEANGVSPEAFRCALENNAVFSGTSALKLPCLLNQDFAPRFSLDNMVKDIHLAADLCRQAGFTSTQAQAFLASAAPALAQGCGSLDFSVIGTTTHHSRPELA